MNNKKFAGFNLDDVFNNEEERLRKEKDEEEARKRKEKLEEKLKNKKAPAPVAPAIPSPAIDPAPSPAISTYLDLEFEPTAHREPGKTDKALLYFDASQQRIISAGYERHARPQEAFGLIIDGLEGKLKGTPLQAVYEDMFKSYGEWLSMAFERQEDILIAHLDPEGLVWNGSAYSKQNFKSSDEKQFDIAGKDSDKWIPLKEFDDTLVQHVYTKPFKELPKEMQEGDRYARIALPADGTIWPVGRVGFVGRYCIDLYYYGRASRGVRRAKNFPCVRN